MVLITLIGLSCINIIIIITVHLYKYYHYYYSSPVIIYTPDLREAQ